MPPQNSAMATFTADIFVSRWISQNLSTSVDFCTRIHCDDEMYLFAYGNVKSIRLAQLRYFSVGKKIFQALQQIVNHHFADTNLQVLDFACGYGRVTRHMMTQWRNADIWASDISHSALAFQSAQLYTNTFPSTYTPSDVNFPTAFDCILVCSLFSHLPQKTFTDWMDTLYGALSERGILVFTVHDQAMLPATVRMPELGHLYVPSSENAKLDKNEYGTAYVAEHFIQQMTRMITGKSAIRVPGAINNAQDIYVISKVPSIKDFTLQESFSYHPIGSMTSCSFEEQSLHCCGAYVVRNVNARYRILVDLNGERTLEHVLSDAQVKQGDEMPWRLTIKTPQIALDDFLVISIFDALSQSHIIAANHVRHWVITSDE